MTFFASPCILKHAVINHEETNQLSIL